MKNRIIIALLLLVIAAPAMGYGELFMELMPMPDSVTRISDLAELTKYLDSPSEIDRSNGCQRIGQIGGEDAFNLLRLKFEMEPWQNSRPDKANFRYYVLTAIGQAGTAEAKSYLKKLLEGYAFHYPWATNKMTADTATVAFGALSGLRIALEPKAYLGLLGAIYVGPKYNREIKIYTYKTIIETGLERGRRRINQNINYLRGQLRKLGPPLGELNDDGTVNAAYVEIKALTELLEIYENGGPIEY